MEIRTEKLHGTESECDSVFASDNDSGQTTELPTRKQKSCIDAVVDEGRDDLSGFKLFMISISLEILMRSIKIFEFLDGKF